MWTKWTKSQKIAGAVLGLAVVAFGVDRWVLSAPGEAAEPDAAAELVVSRSPAPAAAAARTPQTSRPVTAATAPAATQAVTLASRLSAMSVARRFDYEPVGDAFRPAASWFPPQPEAATPTAAAGKAPDAAAKPAKPKVDYAALFAERHELTAVMSNQAGGMAIVNGKVYVPGQSVGGFKLTELGDQHATFTGRGTTVTLRLKPAPGSTAAAAAAPAVADVR